MTQHGVQVVDRRSLLRRIGTLGLALPVLGALVAAACSDEDDGEDAPAQGTTQAPQQLAVDLPFLPHPELPPPITRTTEELVRVELETVELDARIADGAGYRFWTFNGTVPGPMVRVREGDTVELTLKNSATSAASYNIDLHAVNGPGGGAVLTGVAPGESKSFRFKALNPGVFVYHCAVPPIPMHISNGMYGLIVVEPREGLPPVDREFYVCQGEMYTEAPAGSVGMHGVDFTRLLAENPSYVVFNGAVGSITGDRALRANVGERVRLYFGVGGPNLTSAFHVIGEIFDVASIHGSLTDLASNVQTVTVSPGAATMVEFDVEVPGTYLLVDHALSRLDKGAAGHLIVEGDENPELFGPVSE